MLVSGTATQLQKGWTYRWLTSPIHSNHLSSPYSLMAALCFPEIECESVTHSWPKEPNSYLLRSSRDYWQRFSSLKRTETCEKISLSSSLPTFKWGWGIMRRQPREEEEPEWTRALISWSHWSKPVTSHHQTSCYWRKIISFFPNHSSSGIETLSRA